MSGWPLGLQFWRKPPRPGNGEPERRSPHLFWFPHDWGLGGLLLLPLLFFSGYAAAIAPSHEVTLSSALPTGNPTLDRIWIRYFPAVAVGPAPAVVLVPPVGSDERDGQMGRFAVYLADRGIACAVLCLPYHGKRRISPAMPSLYFAGLSVPVAVHAFQQSASDAGTVGEWLAEQPGVDPKRIGIVGVSLGAIVAHLAMGLDSRFTAGVAVEGGGDLLDLYRRSLVSLYWILQGHPRVPPSALAPMRAADPLTYAADNRPRRVLMIEAARDLLIPPPDALALWRALGEPPIQWLDTGHFAIRLDPGPVFRASADYLWGVWRGLPDSQIAVSRVWAPTIKLGFLDESGVGVSPAVQWQVLTLLSRPDHLSLLSLNLGLTGLGLFTGLALTVTPFVDVGLSPRWDGRAPRPYLSLHGVF